MADLKETAVWEAVRQLETSDPVMGGENGISNTAPRQLANRTLWLKNELANSIASINTGKANKATTLAGYGITDAHTSAKTDSLLLSKADKTVTIATGIGLLNGGDLSASRTLTIDKATVTHLNTNTLNKVVTTDILGPILATKAAAATTLDGYGIANAYTKTETDNLLKNKANTSNTLAGYGIADGATKKELLTISSITGSLALSIDRPISLVNITSSDGMKDHNGYAYIRTTQFNESTQYTQTAMPYANALAPKMYGRHCYQSDVTPWGRFDGADWNAAATETGHIYNKPNTLSGFGINDWVVKSYTGAENVIADAAGNGMHSYGAGAKDSATWSDGTVIGPQKMLQYGTSAWDSQIATQAYGECTFIRSRRAANGAYQTWKRLDGADWNASEKSAGFISNKPTTIAGYGITDALTVNTSQSISGIKTFSDTTGFLSAKSVGYGAWQDTVRLNGALPTVSNGSMGIGFHTADRNMYIIDITGQSYLATFNFAAKSVSVSGSINATNGFNKSGVETAYQNVNFIAGDGLTGGGTLAANRSFAIDKATASDLTAGTLNKVVTADVLKPALDAKANTAINLAVGIGLTGGGTLAANRSFTIDKAASADLTAGTLNKVVTADVLKPALDAKANTAINLAVGIGLTGGGTLTANRSFAIDKAAASDLTAGTLNKVVTADVLKAELDKKSNLGVGQTYNNVKTSRTTNIDYVNNSDKPILVLISVICSSQNQQVQFLIDGIEIQTLAVSESGREWPTIRPGFSVIVPVGATYKVTGLNTNIMNWTELR